MKANGQVLIVDDDPVMRRLMAAALRDQGCSVDWVESGLRAIDRAMADLPDLILLDVLLPDIDGIEVCRRVRAEPLLAEVPVIMITTLNDPDARLNSLEAGADDFITKPVDFIELRARVGSILRLNRYRRLLDERTQRQRAEEEILRRNRELSLLNSFIVALAAKLRTVDQIEQALRDACRILIQALDLSAAHVWLRPEDQIAVMAASALADPLDGPAPPPHPHTTLDQEAPDAAGSVVPTAQALAQHGQSPLQIEILLNGHVRGAITLEAAQGRVLDMQEAAFVQSLAGALGQAIETVLLHQQLQRHVNNLEGIVATRTNELQAERDRTQAILEALGEGVIVTDAAGIIRYANPATTVLTGYNNSNLVARAWSEILGNGSTAPLYQMIQEQVASGLNWRGEVSSIRRDGSFYDAALTVAPLFEPHLGDQTIGMVSIQRDITPLKAAERLKDHFISNISHELRTPLSIIALHSGNLDTLYDRLADEQRRQLIRQVRIQTDLLEDLIGDVLELSRLDHVPPSLDLQTVNLDALIRQEITLLQPLAERKGLRLEMRSTQMLLVQGDEAQLHQCVRNLIGNAIKFTPLGGEIICDCRKMDADPVNLSEWPAYINSGASSYMGLRVVDNGIGIGAEHLPHLFERFYRVQNQTRVPGTGLGLAITHELITRHGGWLGVASTPGVGSTFAFYLPLSVEG